MTRNGEGISLGYLHRLGLSLFLCSSLFVQGCDTTVDTSQIEELSKDLEQVLKDTKSRVSELSPSSDDLKNMTTDEFSKLHAFEYKIAEFPRDKSAGELEDELTALGKERWECFEVEALEKQYRLFCRRRPETYLRYLPRMFP